MSSNGATAYQEDTKITVQSVSGECELCPKLQNLEKIAHDKYAKYRGLAERDDNKQEKYDPLASGFLKASELMVKAVLRDVQRELDHA